MIKLGGSVITRKDGYKEVKREVLNRLSREISEAGGEAVIVHGGGSFGHPVGRMYGVHGSGDPWGASLTMYSMHELNMAVLDALIRHGVKAASFPPHSYIVGDSFFLDPIEAGVEAGLTPVTYGDVVIGSDGRFVIISGDQLSYILAKRLNADRIIFVMDVKGIYQADPKLHSDAKLIRRMGVEDAERLLSGLSEGGDATGGIRNKLRVAVMAAKSGVEVIFISGYMHNALKRAIRGEEVLGTILKSS